MPASELHKWKGNQFLGIKAGKDYIFAAVCEYNYECTHSWERLSNLSHPALPQFIYPIPPCQVFAFCESLCETNKKN